jgi:hypothetical protein
MTEHRIQYGETIVCDGGDYTIELPNGDILHLTGVAGTLRFEQDQWGEAIAHQFEEARKAGERIGLLLRDLLDLHDEQQA